MSRYPIYERICEGCGKKTSEYYMECGASLYWARQGKDRLAAWCAQCEEDGTFRRASLTRPQVTAQLRILVAPEAD